MRRATDREAATPIHTEIRRNQACANRQVTGKEAKVATDSDMTPTSAAPRIPKYFAIYLDIATKIHKGQIAAGQQLPTQRTLCSQYRVSLMTLRQALRALADEGLVTARQGDGTYAASRFYRYDPSRLQTLATDMISQGAAVETKVLSVHNALPPISVARRLSLLPDRKVSVIERLRYSDGAPIMLQKSYLPVELAALIDTKQLRMASLSNSLTATGRVTLAHATETVKPTLVTRREAGLLQQKENSPALLSERVAFDENENAFLYDRTVLPSGRAFITIEHKAESTEMRYQFHPGRR